MRALEYCHTETVKILLKQEGIEINAKETNIREITLKNEKKYT